MHLLGKPHCGTSLAVQWLNFAFNVQGCGTQLPGQGAYIHMPRGPKNPKT